MYKITINYPGSTHIARISGTIKEAIDYCDKQLRISKTTPLMVSYKPVLSDNQIAANLAIFEN